MTDLYKIELDASSVEQGFKKLLNLSDKLQNNFKKLQIFLKELKSKTIDIKINANTKALDNTLKDLKNLKNKSVNISIEANAKSIKELSRKLSKLNSLFMRDSLPLTDIIDKSATVCRSAKKLASRRVANTLA